VRHTSQFLTMTAAVLRLLALLATCALLLFLQVRVDSVNGAHRHTGRAAPSLQATWQQRMPDTRNTRAT
jgi:hypothetical protein